MSRCAVSRRFSPRRVERHRDAFAPIVVRGRKSPRRLHHSYHNNRQDSPDTHRDSHTRHNCRSSPGRSRDRNRSATKALRSSRRALHSHGRHSNHVQAPRRSSHGRNRRRHASCRNLRGRRSRPHGCRHRNLHGLRTSSMLGESTVSGEHQPSGKCRRKQNGSSHCSTPLLKVNFVQLLREAANAAFSNDHLRSPARPCRCS